MSAPEHEVVIVGAGFSGIGAAIGLDRAGIRDWVLLEEGDGVGGAWHWNTYPGVGVDIPSASYQFSFAQHTDWSRVYAPGRELKAYAEDCVDRFSLRSRIRFNTPVQGVTWNEHAHVWEVETEAGTVTARFVVNATGVLTKPKPPDIDGLDTFTGTVMHTARWDHDVDLSGTRVVLIGTGASAVQVVPEIAPVTEHLTVLQRTPIWCLPKVDGVIPPAARWALAHVPGVRSLARLVSQSYVEVTFPLAAHFHGRIPLAKLGERTGRRHLEHQVKDPEVRAKLTPRYGLGCKRPSFSNTYLRTFNRDDVTLETTGIASITPAGVRLVDGREHAADVLVLATGFKVFDAGNLPPFPVAGTGGVDLEGWFDEHRLQAYEGTSVPGFPNLFFILGPYGYNGASYFTLIENQVRHIVRCLTHVRAQAATAIEVTPEANARYFEEMLARRGNQVFFRADCAGANSYYFDRHGDVPLRPSPTLEATLRSRRFPLSDYRCTTLADAPAPELQEAAR